MRALTIDDEWILLEELTKAVEASPNISSVKSFSYCKDLLEYIEKEEADVAFLDIHMGDMTGLELAARIREKLPECKIVFCTGYDEYALEAFKMHASGYLMKPISANAVQDEINHIKGKSEKNKLLEVKCFGTFEVFANGNPLLFKRSKTKELLAYLVDRNGAGVTGKQICAVLWEENLDDSRNMNYLWQLLGDLRTTLKNAGFENILIKSGSFYSIDRSQMECDYFQFCEIGKPAYTGEYMSQYEWAEETNGMLERKKYDF